MENRRDTIGKRERGVDKRRFIGNEKFPLHTRRNSRKERERHPFLDSTRKCLLRFLDSRRCTVTQPVVGNMSLERVSPWRRRKANTVP